MATLKPFAANPIALGGLAPTAGAPVQVTSNFTDISTERFHKLTFTTPSGNTALKNVYVMSTSAAASATTLINVVLCIPPGAERSITSDSAQNTILASSFWVDVDTSGDKVAVAGYQQ